MTSELALAAGPGGWVKATAFEPDQPLVSAWVRFFEDAQRWKPQGSIFLPEPTPAALRALPLHRIVLAVEASDVLRMALAARSKEQAHGPGTVEFYKSFNDYLHPEPPLTLERPARRRLPDSFYERVAETYRAAIARGLKPRRAIAEAADVSLDVSGRWIREARKRGLLPPTSPGKVGL
jgi:hypothetical protein